MRNWKLANAWCCNGTIRRVHVGRDFTVLALRTARPQSICPYRALLPDNNHTPLHTAMIITASTHNHYLSHACTHTHTHTHTHPKCLSTTNTCRHTFLIDPQITHTHTHTVAMPTITMVKCQRAHGQRLTSSGSRAHPPLTSWQQSILYMNHSHF